MFNFARAVRGLCTTLVDTGMRPDECYRMRWEQINWKIGTGGILHITLGKTPAARRMLHLTPRVRFILQARWEFAGCPNDGWVWPAPTKTGHVNHASLKKQHARAFRVANETATQRAAPVGPKPALLKPWVLYSFRHTFLTRLGESGCDAWTLARIAGHSSLAISSRYVHPSEGAVQNAMSRMGGHKIGHSQKSVKIGEEAESLQAVEGNEEIWRARRDSNSRPIAPEAIALSS